MRGITSARVKRDRQGTLERKHLHRFVSATRHLLVSNSLTSTHPVSNASYQFFTCNGSCQQRFISILRPQRFTSAFEASRPSGLKEIDEEHRNNSTCNASCQQFLICNALRQQRLMSILHLQRFMSAILHLQSFVSEILRL